MATVRLAALLGSINVGGNRLKMADLRAALEAAGFANVATVTASGNVLFDGDPVHQPDYAARIAEVIKETFGIATFAVVTTREGLLGAVAENPFADDGADNLVHVHFLESKPGAEAFLQLASDHEGRGSERLAPGTAALHIDFVDSAANSKLTGPFLLRRLGCRGTARNIRSIRRIAEAMA
ncbi:uncharacterized protein (DUF1697 family) [Erythromicrobium ramosum]|uniref:DUF1697 domain-containing protein n=1 Tax=Erythrobacter ramosus TaxID=35811 RepID=A0A6I4UQ00_9SPHN|nr:DUF1697 domain-containing protein [Erythrobacter ramosus]MBB3776994.1 uncharacterized protein (DUF1697 family) [Erythrobacter ramosus]MXP39864.1 DUF1697 domain-containing protein [Erythrobacter ramosus]